MIFPTLFMHQKHPQLSSLLQLLGEIKYIIMSTRAVNNSSPYVKFQLIFQGRGGIGMSQTQVSDVSLQWSVAVQGESTIEMRLMRRRFKLGPWHSAEEITGLTTPWANSTYWHEWEKLARVKDFSFLNTHLEFQHLNFLLTLVSIFLQLLFISSSKPHSGFWKAQGSLVWFTKTPWHRKLQIIYIRHGSIYKKQRNLLGNLSIHLSKHLQDSFEGRWANKPQKSSHQESILFY